MKHLQSSELVMQLFLPYCVVLVQRDAQPDAVSSTAPKRQGVWTPFIFSLIVSFSLNMA